MGGGGWVGVWWWLGEFGVVKSVLRLQQRGAGGERGLRGVHPSERRSAWRGRAKAQGKRAIIFLCVHTKFLTIKQITKRKLNLSGS